MVEGKGPTVQLCNWACSTRYGDVPDEVRRDTVTILYDTIGGMVASSTLPTCQPVLEMVKALGANGPCSIVGHPVKTTVTYAALVNGTIGHGDEVDPGETLGGYHFASTIVPAAISVGQYVGTSGKELVRAIALGSEVTILINRLQRDVLEHSERRFWFSTGCTMGAAVVASLLLNLDAEQMEYALGLAAYQAAGMVPPMSDPTHQSKSLQLGIAAQGGVTAALLAQSGCHSPPEILGRKDGFFDAFTGHAELGERLVEALGKTWVVRQVQYKRYPVGMPDHPPLHLFLQMLKKHKLEADDIADVEVMLSMESFQTVDTLKHPSVYQATILSMAAVFGEVGFKHTHDSRYYNDPRVEAFKERIKLIPQSGVTKARRLEGQLRIRTRNGEVYSEAFGSVPSMNKEDLRRKFRALVGLRANEKKVLALERKLEGIDEVNNVAPLISELELPD